MQQLLERYRVLKKDEKIEVAFLFQAGTVWASWDSIYRSCIADERFAVQLILMEETAVETSHMVGAKRFLQENHIDYISEHEINWNAYTPHVAFVQFPYDTGFHTPRTLTIHLKNRGTRVVYVPYGIEISDTEIARKDHFNSFVVENAWRVYTGCEGLKAEYDKYCRNRRAVRVCGSPKFDAISNRDALPLADEIIEKAAGRKIVVWKMHFPKKIVENGCVRQITPYVSEYISFAEKLDDYSDVFFVVMAHPRMLNGVVSSDTQGDDSLMQQVGVLFDIVKSKSNVYLDIADDYRNSFYHADAIVLDRSAVMIEAAMLGVPVLFMKNQDYFETLTAPVDKVVNSFYVGDSCKDMEEFMEMFRAGKDVKREVRENCIAETFPYMDGACGDRIKEDIARGMLEEQREKPRVIFYGTGDNCKYYMEKQGWARATHFELQLVVDTDERKWGKDFFGYTICAPEEMKRIDFDAIVVMTEAHYLEIKKKLVYDMYMDERKIWRLDEYVFALQDIREDVL